MKKQLFKQFSIILFIAITCITTFTSNCFISYAEDEIYYMTDDELDACFTAYLQSRGGNLITTLPTRLVYTDLRLKNFLQSPENNTGISTMEQARTTARFYRRALSGSPDNAGTMFLAISQPTFWGAYTSWLMQKHFLGPYTHFDNNGLLATDNNQQNAERVYSGNYVADKQSSKAMTWVVTDRGAYNRDATIEAYGSYYKLTSGFALNRAQYYRENTTYNTAWWGTDFGQSTSGTDRIYLKWQNTNKERELYEVYCSGNTSSGTIKGYFWTDFHTTFPDQNLVEEWGYPIIYKTSVSDTRNYLGFLRHRDDGITYVYNIFDGIFYNDSDLNKQDTGTSTNVLINIDFSPTYNNNITRYPDVNVNGKLYIQPRVKINGEFKPVTNINDYINNSNTEQNTNVTIDVNPPSDDDTPVTPPTPPDLGGGDSTTGGDYGGTGEDGTINYPDFNFHLPDINWSIDGLSEKFPFSIPFDLMAMFEILNAEPQTPEIQAQIDLKVVTWDIDYDLHDFDGVAEILRNLEFIAFCIGLILITRSLIKG